jgi:16S rRNA (guanine527-N7)-methyltransferase
LARPPQRVDTPEAFAKAFSVSRETVDRLRTYETLLRKWQKAVNLVAPATLDEIWHRHFADSAQLAALTGDDPRVWLDLGSGGGFPGMVIAILLANRPGSVIHLVESNARKCAFLREVSRATGAAVEIHDTRIESLAAGDTVPRPGIVTARALAPLDRLLGQAAPFFGPESRGLFLKGRSAEEEIETARVHFAFEARLYPSRTDAQARIVEITALRERDRD